MKKVRQFLALMAFLSASWAHAETFDNQSIVALSKAGIGDAVLLSKINNLPCTYDVSTDKIIELKTAGVSNVVITAMVDRCVGSSRAQGVETNSADPLLKRSPGLYILANDNNQPAIKVIRPTSVTGAHISGNGSLLFPFTAKLLVPRQTAQTTAPSSTPTFYFYFEAADLKTGDFGTSVSAAAQSPSEFSLVKFKPASGQREMTIGKANMFNSRVGIDPKETIQFNVTELGDGIFKVDLQKPLAVGGYAFVLKAGSDAYRIYDFEISENRK